jgi:hypothetical protein
MAENKYYAHSANAKDDWRPLKDHLQNVAGPANKFTAPEKEKAKVQEAL